VVPLTAAASRAQLAPFAARSDLIHVKSDRAGDVHAV
jgi:hypothetical protein